MFYSFCGCTFPLSRPPSLLLIRIAFGKDLESRWFFFFPLFPDLIPLLVFQFLTLYLTMPADWKVLTCFAGWLLLFYNEMAIEYAFLFKYVSYFIVSVPDIQLVAGKPWVF